MMNIQDLKNTITQNMNAIEKEPIHVEAFCAFLNSCRRTRLQEIGTLEMESNVSQRPYVNVAAIGYALAGKIYDNDLVQLFISETTQLSGRTFFGRGRTLRFEIDGIALFGVALGFSEIAATSDQTEWLLNLLNLSANVLKSDDQQLALVLAATAILEKEDFATVPNVELRVALSSACGFVVKEEDKQLAWQSIIETVSSNANGIQLSTAKAVFDFSVSALASLSVTGSGVNELSNLLGNLSAGMSHWTFENTPRVKNRPTRKWHIDNEYHVQNLLWAILKPIFPDLVDEEALPKIGHKSTRYDLGIPSLQTIIEVKFMRRSGQAACTKIIDELAADTALYFNKSSETGYKRMIAFIWDECRQTEEYDMIKRGLESLNGLEKAIILPRPERMGEQTKSDNKSAS
ncbi:PD-(D/E)XK nuclease domain-containing protein [Sneathiella aquimaris]|uniref:PD-(D/E)XK nuclease domain-containing protein n=1 Tax=Sneathiella aquimaris TaxID=2599305 RepID=UPI00146B5EA3|nr:hypothetical protein [Sneathiella aquimaris]